MFSWDEWVKDERMFKYDDEGLRMQKDVEKLAYITFCHIFSSKHSFIAPLFFSKEKAEKN